MFTIYRKDVGGRKFDRYFHKWENAEKVLEEELADLLKSGWKQTEHRDYFKCEKGYYIFYYALKTPKGEDAVLTLMNGYFAD